MPSDAAFCPQGSEGSPRGRPPFPPSTSRGITYSSSTTFRSSVVAPLPIPWKNPIQNSVVTRMDCPRKNPIQNSVVTSTQNSVVPPIDCQDSLKYPNSKGGKTYEDPKPSSGNVQWGPRLSPPVISSSRLSERPGQRRRVQERR